MALTNNDIKILIPQKRDMTTYAVAPDGQLWALNGESKFISAYRLDQVLEVSNREHISTWGSLVQYCLKELT